MGHSLCVCYCFYSQKNARVLLLVLDECLFMYCAAAAYGYTVTTSFLLLIDCHIAIAIHRAYRSLPNSRFFALTFQKKCCRPSSWPPQTAALVTKTARRVADPLRELGSKHAEVRTPA